MVCFAAAVHTLQLNHLMQTFKHGQTIRLDVIRGNQEAEVELELEARKVLL